MRFIELFHKYVNEQPDHLALVDGNGELTYAQLNEKAEELAKDYQNKGIGAGDAVGVCVPYGKDIMVHAIAILKIGAVYVPIDDTYPEDRVNYMLEDSNREKHDSDVALILYTSGTTGRPKGVVHTQHSLMEMVKWPCNHLPVPMSRDTRCGVVTGFTFVATTQMLFSTIAAGGTLCFASNEERKDMTLLYRFIQRQGITHIFMSSSLGMAMMETYDTTGTLMMVGGEKLRSFTSVAGQRLLNCYGSTEGVMVCSAYVDGSEKEIPIGNPCLGVTPRIIDENLQEVAQGEIGELTYTAGFMAREYLHLPEQTSQKWFEVDGVRYYHTGDRVRRDADGNIYCLGRTDNMIKIRGFRVETGEVERQVALVVQQTEIVVVLRTVHGIDRLVCFYQSDKEIDTDAVQREIKKCLAEYMIPDMWVRIDRFPRNANGKVDRKLLPTPSINDERLSAIYNEVEMRVIEAARLVLGHTLSLEDNFFDCGGSSLSAIKLAAQLRTMGINTTGSKIMQLKVLRLVAADATIDYKCLWNDEQYMEISDNYLQRGETIEKVLPLSNEQEDNLFRYMMHPDSPAFRYVFTLPLDSRIKEGELREAIDKISAEYEVLRSSIVVHHHFPFQQVITDRRLGLDCYKISSDESYVKDIKDIFHLLMHVPFDPESSHHIHFAYADGYENGSFLFVQVNTVSLPISIARKAISSLMGCLSAHYPTDQSIQGWQVLLEQATDSDTVESKGDSRKDVYDELRKTMDNGLIRTYSPIRPGVPSVVFVHTGNTGSDAYYRLADKIGDHCAFAVIEPYNLYHQDDIQHGIKAIASKYIEILHDYQKEGPYILGGWCYGGVVAHEMACQLKEQGEEVKHLFMFDSHALNNEMLISKASDMHYAVDRSYFEECPLFQDLREQGMIEAMVRNYSQVAYDILHHAPEFFDGPTTYFKPMQTPMAATGKSLDYWKEMMKYDAGNFENYCNRELLKIVEMPHEHDLMMDDESMAVSLPVILDLLKKL